MKQDITKDTDEGERIDSGPGDDSQRHTEALEAAASEMVWTGHRFFRTIKARMMRNMELQEMAEELGETHMWVLHSLMRGRNLASQLARQYNITYPSMSRIIENLVEMGYVERRPDAEDRRCIFLQLTEQGTDKGQQLERQFHKAVVQFLSPLSEEQLEDITKAYQHVRSLLDDGGAEVDPERSITETALSGARQHRMEHRLHQKERRLERKLQKKGFIY